MHTIKYIISIILTIAGAITIIELGISSLCNIFPKLMELKSNTWGWLAKKYKYKKLKKLAIKSDVEHAINLTVFELQSELPKGWTRKASVQWVSNLSKKNESLLDEIILRIRPLENQDMNLIYGVYSFFDQSMFPRIQTVIPNNIRKSSVLLVTQRALCLKKHYLKEQFEDSILDDEIKEDGTILKYFEQLKTIDNRGFFTSVFLREIYELATKIRFQQSRNRIEKEIESILLHIIQFSKEVISVGHSAVDSMWHKDGPVTNYTFLHHLCKCKDYTA